MQFVLGLALIAGECLAAQDPIELFQSLAYTRELPSKQKPAKAVFRLLEILPKGERVPDKEARFRPSDRFQLEVNSPLDGWFYLFADREAEPALTFPRGGERNEAHPGQPFRLPRRLAFEPAPSSGNLNLILAITREPLQDADKLTFAEAKSRLAGLASSTVIVEQRTLRFESPAPTPEGSSKR